MQSPSLPFRRLTSPRLIGLAILALPLAALLVAVGSFAVLLTQYRDAARGVTHTVEATAAIDRLLGEMVDAETGVRGYLATGDARFLEPYDAAPESYAEARAALETLVQENPRQMAWLAAADAHAQEAQGYFATLSAEAGPAADPGEASSRALLRQSKTAMDALRQDLRQMQAEESQLLAERQAWVEQVQSWAVYAILGSLLLGLLGVLAAARLFEGLFRRARGAVRLRDEFLSVAAHELRTPLTSLRGYAELALRRARQGQVNSPEQVERAFEVILQQADKQTRLVNQLLDVSRMDTPQPRIDPQATDLTRLVVDVVAMVQATAGQHSLVVLAPPPLEVLVDPLRLEQVLVNLLDNAVKYSPDGGQIDVAVVADPAGGVEIGVRDRGLGIPPERRAHIFDRYYRAHAEARVSGFGLGLFISHQIVTLHGGELRAEFPADGGTRFVVRLPAAIVPSPDQPAAVATRSAVPR
jgi:signal transduction histidine kinase